MTIDPEAAYYQAVEEYFVSRRGDPLFLSNADWSLVRRWRLAGIPLRVVLRGVRDALDAHAHGWSRDRKVGSLAYCAREVETARDRWRRALALDDEGPARLGAALAGFATALDRAVGLGPQSRALADGIARELRAWEGASGLEQLTAWLSAREAGLLAALAAEEAPERRAAREAAVAESLRAWRARMPPRVLELIEREANARRLLESHGLPRLSLFHLEGGGEPEP